jgi:hypothetical protein
VASVFVKHRVADYDAWKKVFDEHQPVRAGIGATGHTVCRAEGDPNTVIIALRVKDLARAHEFTASDDLREIMQKAGVQGPPEFWYAEDMEDKDY